MGRLEYDGDWFEGKKSGQGIVKYKKPFFILRITEYRLKLRALE
jgi:hypothetical protein